MPIKECIQKKGIIMGDSLGLLYNWVRVEVTFRHGSKWGRHACFDVPDIHDDRGVTVLEKEFESYCKENNIPEDVVESIVITTSAKTRAGLDVNNYVAELRNDMITKDSEVQLLWSKFAIAVVFDYDSCVYDDTRVIYEEQDGIADEIVDEAFDVAVSLAKGLNVRLKTIIAPENMERLYKKM